MSDICKDYYVSLANKCSRIAERTFENEKESRQSEAHSFLQDIDAWVDILSERPESDLFLSASKEYQFSLLAVTQGLYRQAFMGLRLFMELTISGVYFSAHEYLFRKWKIGDKDISWGEFTNSEDGVFSTNFCKAFKSNLRDQASLYQNIANNIYSDCSSYVHGNPNTHKTIPEELDYDESLYEEWHNKCSKVREITIFLFCLRYIEFIDQCKIPKIEESVNSHVSHIAEIRDSI
jgi:hypothetical protein